MNILIPLGGLGQRYKDVGYESPKPLIKALGKEIIIWLLDSLKTDKFDSVFIVYNKELSVFGFESFFNDKDIKLFKLSRNTQGPVETCYEFLSLLPQKHQKEKLLILDGDTFYKFDLLKKVRKLKYSSVIYSDTTLSKPIYSYIKEKNGNLMDIKEKIKISNKFNIGAYFFESTYQFLSHSSTALKKNRGCYISQIYYDLIKSKKKVKAVYIPNKFFTCLGTPDQLISFCTQKNNLIKKSFCFDLKSIINLSSKANNKFSINKPLENLKFLKMLKKQGHNIIIQSSKLSKIKKNKVLKHLKDLNVPYDKIFFSKPIADYYIDKSCIDSNSSLNFKLGFYDNDDTESRSFNKITIGEHYTIKTSREIIKLNNEISYISKLPKKIKSYFPNIHDYGKDWYKMDTVKGTNISYLFLNNLLTSELLEKILKALSDIHCFTNNSNNIYGNYLSKLKNRIKTINKKFIKVDQKLLDKLIILLTDYQKKKLGINGIIHGDPVFSNIFIDYQGSIIFIDPRGGQLKNFSLYGDIIYDYAKIYQSLIGYDFHLFNFIPQKNNNLIRAFEKIFIEKFSKQHFDYLKIITASLYLTLIPFHKKELSTKFYKQFYELI